MKRFKPLIIISGSILLLFFAIIIFVKLKFGNDVKQLVLNQVNENITTQLVADDIKLSVLKRFPQITVVIKNAKLVASPVSEQAYPNLAEIENLYIILNLKGFLKKNYIIERLDASYANIYVEIDASKSANYNIFKNNKPNEIKPYTVNLEKIGISKFHLIYLDRSSKNTYYTFIDNTEIEGNINQDLYNLTLTTSIQIDSAFNKSKMLIQNYPIEFSTSFIANSAFNEFQFNNSDITISEIALLLNGKFNIHKNEYELDLEIQSDDIPISKITELLPDSTSQHISDFIIEGKSKFNASLRGVYSHSKMPNILCEITLQDGKVKKSKTKLEIDRINLKGSFDNKGSKSFNNAVLTISDFKAYYFDKLIHSNFEITNFKDPLVKGRIDGELVLDNLIDIVDSSEISDLRGLLTINANFITRLNEIKKLNLGPSNALKGTIGLKDLDIEFYNSNLYYKNFNGLISFENQRMTINEYDGYIANSHISLKGHADNVFKYLSKNGDTLNIIAQLNSKYLNIDELFNSNQSNSTGKTNVVIPKKIIFNFNIDCKKAIYQKVIAENVKGKVTLSQHGIVMENLKLKAANGLVKANGRIFEENNGQISVDGIFNFTNININTLFAQLDNFGQNVLTSKNIEGNLNSRVRLNSYWNSDLTPDIDKLFAIAEVSIDNGELIDFEPVTKLLKFVKLKKIDQVKFDKIENTFLIKDNALEIPEMDINSDAFNLTVAGTHQFNDMVDYHFKVNLKDLYFSKHNQSKGDFGNGTDDGQGGMDLFVLMSGNINNPKFKYDKSAVAEKMQEGLKKEKQEFLDLFRKNKKETEEEYELEWDEK